MTELYARGVGGFSGRSASGAVRGRYMRAGVGAGLGLLLLVAVAPSASAHDRLVESDPASGAVLTAAPSDVVLTFNVEVQPLGTVLELRNSDGEQASSAETTVSGREVSLPVSADLSDDDYTLLYRVTSSDGHPISGEVPFTLESAAASPGANATTSPGPVSTSTPGESVTPSPAASAATTEPGRPTQTGQNGQSDSVAVPAAAGFPWAVGLGALVVVAVLAGVGVAGRRRAAERGR